MQNKRDSPQYRAFAKQVFTRDKHKCILCGSSKKLNAHHLNAWHWYPQGRYDPNNAVTLCGHRNGCHVLFHKMFGNQRNTKQQFDQFTHYRKLMLKKKK
jgi:predicted restriction endonuclease